MIVIGASLGGTAALRGILSRLPAGFPDALAVVLHRHRESDDALIDILQKQATLPVREVCDKDPICRGCVQVAPADYHLLVEAGHFSLSVDELVQYARPSIDVLFESAAEVCGAATVAVLLTGANHDGARGAARVRQAGGTVIVQDPSTAESAVMPAAALALGAAHYLCRVEEIAGVLVKLRGSGQR